MKHENSIRMLVDGFRPKDWTQNSLTVYCSALADLDEQYIQRRVLELLQTSKFMPSIAEIRSSEETVFSADDIMIHAKYLLNHPSQRNEQDTLTLSTVKVIEKLGGWVAFGRSPDPQFAPPSQVQAYKQQIKEALGSVDVKTVTSLKAIEGV